MSFSYNLVLVALSVAVAAQASFMALILAQRIPAAFALNRRLLTAGSALSLAVGVWSMHFIGMLAVVTPFRLDYAVLPTLISLLICVLAAGIAVVLASLRPRRMLILAAAVLGLGIVAMHFIGMMAMRECASVSYDPAFVLASVVIACTASGFALWLAFSAQRKLPLLLCAIILGLAISGMHYTAMGGTRLQPNPVAFAANGAAISSDLLAAIVSVVAFSISGVLCSRWSRQKMTLASGSAGLLSVTNCRVRAAPSSLTTAQAISSDRKSCCQSSATAASCTSPPTKLSPFTPTRITPIFSMAPTTCSARCQSRKSPISCQSRRFFAPIAATLSI